MKKINYKKLIIYICVPLLLGALVGFLSGSFAGFGDIVQPKFLPPKIVFPIVWTVLYILMGISRYLIDDNLDVIKLYNVQLGINLLWSFIFFSMRLYLLAFLWLILLIIVVFKMIIKFKNISNVAAFLQIPYLIWLVFAGILNLAIVILN